jgi:CHAT domain-containing protein
MSRFYQSLRKGTDARESLRLSQILVAQESKFAHPFFWAPFDLIGDWR